MSRACSTCAHPQVKEINRRLTLGGSLTGLARDFNLHPDALARHRNAHLTPELKAAVKRADTEAHADDLLGELRMMNKAAKHILATALKSGQLRTALDAIGKVARLIEVQGKLLGEINEGPTITVVDTSALVGKLHERIARLAPAPLEIEHDE